MISAEVLIPFIDNSLTLRACSIVSKHWHQYLIQHNWNAVIAQELKERNISVFGPEEWKKHHNIEIAANYPRLLIDHLDKVVGKAFLQLRYKKIKNCEQLASLVKEKYQCEDINFADEVDTSEAKWLLLTELIPKSKRKTPQNQIALLKSPYRQATIYEISLIVFNHYYNTGQRLLDDDPLVYTRAYSTSQKSPDYIVGAYFQEGLTVMNLGTAMPNTGIMAIREIPLIQAGSSS